MLLVLLSLLISDFHVFGEQQGALNYEEKANDQAEKGWENDDDNAEDYAKHRKRWFRDGDTYFL